MKNLRIATYNIRNITDHYEKRKALLESTVEKMYFDIAAIQEVSFYEYNQLRDINKNEKYEVFFAPTQLNNSKVNDVIDPYFQIDGNAIFVDKNIILKSKEITHKILHLSAIRCAHMVTLDLDFPGKLNIINVHLHHHEDEENIRVYEMKHVLKWINFNTNEEDFTVVLGDFNTLPNSLTYEFMIEKKFKSAYHLCYGEEPIRTFHSDMMAPNKDTGTEGTYDYIFFKWNKYFFNESVRVESVQILGQEESDIDKGIYPSDHFALLANLQINNFEKENKFFN